MTDKTQHEKEVAARKDGNKPDYNQDIADAMGDAAPLPETKRDNLYLDDNGERIGAGTGVSPGHGGGDQMNIGAGDEDRSAKKQDPVTPKTDNPAKTPNFNRDK